MKQLSPITIGKYTFEASVEHVPRETFLTVKVWNGTDALTGKMTCMGGHDYTCEQFEKDINDFATRLAGELAGKIHTHELAQNFTKG